MITLLLLIAKLFPIALPHIVNAAIIDVTTKDEISASILYFNAIEVAITAPAEPL